MNEQAIMYLLTWQAYGGDPLIVGIFDHYQVAMNAVEHIDSWQYIGEDSGLWLAKQGGIVWSISEFVLNYASVAALSAAGRHD